MKRIISVLLLVVMLLTTSLAIPALAEAKLETLSLEIMNPVFSSSPLGTIVMDEWLARLEKFANEELGVTLDLKWQEPTFSSIFETQAVYLAAGDFPDIFFIWNYSDAIDVGDSGMLVDINQYLDQMPNYKVFLEADPANAAGMVSGETGSMYTFSDARYSETFGTSQGYVIRFDILQKHNLTPPTTMEELYDVCKQLKALYPDSYPLNTWNSDLITYILTWNHTRTNVYWNGEKYAFGPIDDEARVKAAVEWMAKMYAEGLIDPEYAVDTAEQNRAKMLDGTNFVITDQFADQIMQYINGNEAYPGVQWGFTRTPDNLFGETSWQMNSKKASKYLVPTYNTVVSSKTKDPEKVCRLIDYAKYSEEMLVLVNWGIEGVTYHSQPDGSRRYDDSIMAVPAPATELAQYGLGTGCRSGFILMPQMMDAVSAMEGNVPVWKDGQYYTSTIYEFTQEVGGVEAVPPYEAMGAHVASFSEDEKSDISMNMTPISTYVNESLTKFIVGDLSVAEDWDNFIANISNYGDIEYVLEVYNSKLE